VEIKSKWTFSLEHLLLSLTSLVCRTIKEVQRRFSLFVYQHDVSAIPGDFLDFVFMNATRNGGVEEYEQVMKVYKKPPTPQYKVACMRALCSTRDAKLLERSTEFMYSSEVKMQDMMYFFSGLAGNTYARRQLWQSLRAHLSELVIKFKGNFSLGRIVKSSFDRFSTEEDLMDVLKFFEDKDTKTYDQSLKQGMDAVRAKTAWLERDVTDVEEWLKQNGMSFLFG
jgi:aminopeptidase 2